MKNKLITYIFQWALIQLKKDANKDVRLIYDNPEGYLTFQGNIKYAKKIPLPKRRES